MIALKMFVVGLHNSWELYLLIYFSLISFLKQIEELYITLVCRSLLSFVMSPVAFQNHCNSTFYFYFLVVSGFFLQGGCRGQRFMVLILLTCLLSGSLFLSLL